jgi:hypothetical protein
MIGNASNVASFASMSDYIRAVESARLVALVTRDMPLAWQLHAPDFQLVSPRGNTWTRERYLRRIEEGGFYLRWDPGPMEVRADGRMAVVRYQATLELDSGDGTGTPFHCWHTDSYALNADLWQVVWSQATEIK